MDDRPLIGVNLLYVRPGYMGGTVRYAHELLRHLVELDRFRLVIYVQEGAFPVFDALLASVERIEIRCIGGLAGRVLVEHLLLPWLAQRDRVDLLFSPGFVSPLWGRFRKVVTIHDLYYRRFPVFVRPWQRRYWRLFLPLSLKRVNLAMAVSDSTRTDLCAAFPWAASKVRRVHLGGDSLCAHVDLVFRKDELPYCLLVGNLTPNKNIGTVLSAFSILQEQGVECRLILAGSDLFSVLEGQLGNLNKQIDIELLEHVDDFKLASLYRQALCLIQASHYEGFGLPVVEAMHAGCPVIASDIPVMREVAGEAALFFDPDSPGELAKAVERLLSDYDLRSSMVVTGHANARRFLWSDSARQAAEVFEDALADE